jgi:hypothetical protein
MIDQLEIDFDLPEVQDDSIPARFARFNAGNPQVYDSLVSLARQFRSRQPDAKLGIAMLYEVLRWNYYMATDSEEPYKLSNDFRACYARLIMEQEEDLAGIFQTKKSVADNE